MASKSQRGVVLILVLVLLLVLGIAATAAVRLAQIETRMSGGIGERSRARQLAEAAVLQTESWLDEAGFSLSAEGQLCQPSGECFSSLCDKGLCFSGRLELDSEDLHRCSLNPLSREAELFQQRSLWTEPNKTQDWPLYDADGDLIASAPVLVEWRCFIPLNPLEAENSEKRYQLSHWQPLYRISAYSRGRDGHSRLLLQTLYSPQLGRQSWREVPILFLP
ncbi:hypothetical protein [Saccharospirillum sp. MSK14-1]|uniref:pilus assembly PilX family protein n=1 Tax=Saccharospirillum sp. MSK14-1 TaxID=1897632 RepID=UPI0011B2212C|nr:hypothetical protein [Saccharospirillum sp. MSK14-1]